LKALTFQKMSFSTLFFSTSGRVFLIVTLKPLLKTLSNYTNHVIDTPLDTAFQVEAWEAPTGWINRHLS